MATTGHESEAINVAGLKASLQKLKTDHIDGKADEATTLAGYGITDAYTKTEVNGLVDTPHQNYVTVAATSQTTAATDVLPASGQAADTIYRVSNWDGSANSGAGAFDATCYSEYAWDDVSNPNKYVFLCVNSQIGEVFDISVYNNNAKYADLAAALNGGANIPQSLQKGGMSVKFVCSSDNKYVQYRLMSDTFNTTPANWQGVDTEPTSGSHSLVESGGVKEYIDRPTYGVASEVFTIVGKVVLSNGTIVNDSQYKITDFLYIKGVKTVTVRTRAINAAFAFYDENKNVVLVYNQAADNVSVPTDAVYLVVNGLALANTEEIIFSPFNLFLYNTITGKSYESLRQYTSETAESLSNLSVKPLKDTSALISDGTVIANTQLTPFSNIASEIEVPTDDGGWDWNPAYLTPSGTLNSDSTEIQSRLIRVVEGATYRYTGKFAGTACMGFYDEGKRWLISIPANSISSNPVTTYDFSIPKGVAYISVNCFKNQSNFSIVCISGAFDENKDNSFHGSPKELDTKYSKGVDYSSVTTKLGQKYFSVTECLEKNVNNIDTQFTLLQASGLGGSMRLYIQCVKPSSDLFQQKIPAASDPAAVYEVDYPMANLKQHLIVERNGSIVADYILGVNRKPFVRTLPAMTVRFMPADETEKQNNTDLKLHINADNDGNPAVLKIKKGNTELYSYSFNLNSDIKDVYTALKSGIESIQGYTFEVEFWDIDNISVSDIVITKEEGLPFVFTYSDNACINGNILYDNAPVMIEALYNDSLKIEFVKCEKGVNFIFNGDYLYRIDLPGNKCDYNVFQFGYAGTEVMYIDYDEKYLSFNGKSPIIKGFACHHPVDSPSGSAINANIGNWTYIYHQMQREGWKAVSVTEIDKYIMGMNANLPPKCYFIEMDDMLGDSGVAKIFDNSELGNKFLNIIKNSRIPLGLMIMLDREQPLYEKLVNGTATEEEKKQLSYIMSNSEVERVRSLIDNYGWSVNLHTFVTGVEFTPTSSYDEVKEGVIASIWYLDRMLGIEPTSYQIHSTGMWSVYHSRVVRMFGIPVAHNDAQGWYSCGDRQSFVNRDDFYSKINIKDYAY